MFKDKTAKVMVVDQSGPVRQMFSSVLKELGYSDIRSASNLKDAIGVLEVEPVDWVITPLFKDDEANGLQILNLISSQPVLKNTRVTLVLDEEELEVLKTAYESGMLSQIIKPFNKDSLKEYFENFHVKFEELEWDHAKLSAHYLGKFLEEEKNYTGLLQLWKALLRIFPGNSRYMLNLASPQFHNNLQDKAKGTLRQVLMMDPELKPEVDKVASELFGENAEEMLSKVEEGSSSINALGINNTVVIDSDDSSRKMIIESLKNLGVPEVFDFDNGEAAWTWLESAENVDLIIQEWRIPKLTGPLIIQKIQKKFPVCPVIVASSLLGEEDEPLAQEMGVYSLIKKPFQPQDLSKVIINVIQQDRMPTQSQVLETKIRKLLTARKYNEAIVLKDKFSKNKEIPEYKKIAIDAEFAYANKEYELARDLSLQVLKNQSDSISLLNFIGKCLMQLRDYVAALKCFKKAQTMSPKNIERLCAIAEASNEIGDKETADAALNQAKNIDNTNESIAETEASMNISEGNTEKAKEIMQNLSSLSSVVSYLNNKAIACARSGLFDEGIALYEKTLESIPEKNKAFLAIVNYNLALAFARMDKLNEAIEQLNKVIALGNSMVLSKAKSLTLRIQKALTQGTPLVLKDSSNEKVKKAPSDEMTNDNDKDNAESTENSGAKIMEEHSKIVAAMDSNPGDLCCFRIFVNPDELTELTKNLLDAKVRFTPREAVAREEAAGLEKLLQRS